MRKRNAFLPEISNSTALITTVSGLIDDIIRVNELIKSFLLFEFIFLIEPTFILSTILTSITRKIPLLVWKYAVIGISIRRAVNNTKVWRCQLCQDHYKEIDLKMSGGTETIRNHLFKTYKIELQTASKQFKL